MAVMMSPMAGFEEPRDFNSALGHLLAMTGTVVDVKVAGPDGKPVANFAGLLIGADTLDETATATDEEELIFDLEDPDGHHNYGVIIVRRSTFEGAELEGGLVLHLRLGPVIVRVMPRPM
jgi:hypothetical protein